jgi:hypothetical protein
VKILVALSAKCDEIGFRIITHCTASLFVVNVKALAAATDLTAPAITR